MIDINGALIRSKIEQAVSPVTGVIIDISRDDNGVYYMLFHNSQLEGISVEQRRRLGFWALDLAETIGLELNIPLGIGKV